MSDVTERATVAWGYTMADIERLTWAALRRKHRANFIDIEERYALAWHGIVLRLCESPDEPAFHELLAAGLGALDDAVRAEYRHHGRDTGVNQAGWGAAPSFNKYWRPIKQARDDGFSEHLVDVLSLPAALSVLTPKQYEAIITLAAYDNDLTSAARALNLSYAAFQDRVRHARRKIVNVWFGDETPPGHGGRSPVARGNKVDTCRSGHDRATHGIQRPDGYWSCRRCKRNAHRRRRAMDGTPTEQRRARGEVAA